LLQGDKENNIDMMMAAPVPEEVNTWKLYEIMRLQLGKTVVLDLLACMDRASWTITPTEQGHVAASGVMRRHKEYGIETLIPRSNLIQMRPLLHDGAEAKALAAKERKLVAINRKNPNYFTGRQLFVQELNAEVAKFRRDGRVVLPKIEIAIMKGHAKRWRDMDGHRREEYERRAKLARTDKEDEIRDRRTEVIASLSIQRLRIAQQDDECGPFRMTDSRLTQLELQEFDNLYTSGRFSQTMVDKLRSKSLQKIGPPAGPVAAALRDVDVAPSGPEKPPTPAWAPLVCLNRAWFADAVLRFKGEGHEEHWRFCYALQSPYLACMVKLQPLLEVRLLADPEDLERASLDDWQHTYQMDWTRFAYTDDGQFSAEWSVHVLQKTLVLRGGRVVGDGAFLSLEEVAGMLPAVPASEREARAAPARGDVPTDVFVQYPWLIDYLTWGPKPGETAVGREAAADRGGGGGDRVPHLDAADVNAEAVMDALHARRLEWHALDRAANVDFMVTLCGGRWTMINLGVAYDCFKAECRTRQATEF
jgi:hypothetical protein